MKLLTKALEKKLPPLYANENKPAEEVTIPVKFFAPVGAATWYATEYDPETRMFFGWAMLIPGCGELGYFSLDDLESVRLPFGLTVERDLYWDETTTLKTIIDRGH